jgi:hypothetical protein
LYDCFYDYLLQKSIVELGTIGFLTKQETRNKNFRRCVMFGSDLFAAAGFADIQSGSAILGSMIFAIVVVLIGIGIKIWKKYGKH